ncbi:MAG TPA: cytochrome d ubiquinol oxidase subunit II [Thermomicrobiales bacterium]|nr:cytochrome d ubiquinol oxidase subunit II [Thermomicrobiales bacterium]
MPWRDVTFDLAFVHGAILLAGVVLYAIFGGADFGGGIWDLLARGERADGQRQQIARAIGPVWEVNHVWLIFVIVLTFTIFPPAFSAISTALYIPLSLVLVGITLRGAAFIFRAYAHDVVLAQQHWGRVFAIASAVTPVLLGMCAGAVASGDIRIENGEVTSSLRTPWLGAFPITIGLLALTTCAYLAAIYLTVETTGALQEDFRRRALGAGVAFAALGTLALPLAWTQAPQIWDGMWTRETWTLIPAAIVTGLVTFWAVWTRRYRLARVTAVIEVTVLLAGWALAQYPYLIVPDLTYGEAAASHAMLKTTLIVYGAGSIFLIPSLILLFSLFKGENPAATGAYGASTGELQPENLTTTSS